MIRISLAVAMMLTWVTSCFSTNPTVTIENPAPGTYVSGTITVSGWAIDNTSGVGEAINTVQVIVDGASYGYATYGVSRSDVCSTYAGRPGCPNVGFTFSLNTSSLSIAIHTITVLATDANGDTAVGNTWITKVPSPPQNYLLATGAPKFNIPEPVPLGFVNAANGNLHIEIPVAATAQRGSRQVIGKLMYDSRIWKVVDTGTSRSWQPANVQNGGIQPYGPGWRFVQTGLSGGGYYGAAGDYDAIAHSCYDVNDYPHTWYEYKNYRYYDLDGNIRWFPLYYDPTTGNSCHTAGTTTTSGPSLDATGYKMDLMTSGQPGNPAHVIAPDGTTVLQGYTPGNYTVWKDTNGNSMDVATGPYIRDSLNRGVVQQFIPSDGSYVEYYVSSSNGQLGYTVYPTPSPVGYYNTSFGQSGVSEYGHNYAVINNVQEIDLPDGTKYQFSYENSYGELSGITLPTETGATETITFTYTNFTDANGGVNRWVNTVTRGGGTWTFAPSNVTGGTNCPSGTSCNQVKLTRPSSDDTVYTFGINNDTWNILTQSYVGSAASGTLLTKVKHEYDTSLTDPQNGGVAFTRMTGTTSTWLGAGSGGVDLVSKSEATYDTFTFNYQGTNYTGSRGNVLTQSDYAYGSGGAPSTPTRQQIFTYLHDSNSSYVAPNIVNKVTDVQAKDASGNVVAETNICYDTGSLTSVTGVTHHDDSNFGTAYTLRGNATIVQQFADIPSNYAAPPSCGSSASLPWIRTANVFDTTGQMLTTTDPKGNATQMSYTDNFTSSGNPTTHAYMTQQTLPVSGTVSLSYYYSSGKPASQTDQNGQTKTFQYDNYFDRPSSTHMPRGGYTSATYNTANQTTITTNLFGTTNGQVQGNVDSLARPTQEILLTDPQGQVKRDTTYDTSGRVHTKSNPYRNTTDSTYGLTTYAYDALSRTMQVTLPDSNTQNSFFGSSVSGAGGQSTQLCSTSTYGYGYPVLSKDEAGKKRQTWTDALGRLIETDEFFTSGTVGTCYLYNVLGNLVEVDQGSQTRTFVYDSLSRLTAETTPEAGTVNYYYTASGGSLCAGSSGALCRVTDARSITTSYTYDAENRPTGKSYSNSDPSVTFYYDQTSYNGLTIANGKGHRTGMSDGSGQTAWSFDADGNLSVETRTIAGVTKTLQYSYNANESISQIYYPGATAGDDLAVQYVYDTAGRQKETWCIAINQLSCTNRHFAYDATFAPHGALSALTLGYNAGVYNGITQSFTYNNRLQPVNLKSTPSGASDVMYQTYSFTPTGSTINNGTVMSVTNNLATNRSQSYTYDELNRLATAQSQATTGSTDCWAQVYTYDRYANLSSIQWPSSGWSGCTATMPTMSLSINQSNNRVTTSGYTYDNAGNVTADGTYSYTWNAEGRMAATAGVTYTYDGDGRRVKKSNGTLYWYGLGGEVLAESDLSGNITSEYIYFNGQRIARRDPSSGTVQYYLADRLGSARLLVDATGAVVNESDYYPYGGERVIPNTSGVTNNYKFTGHERDSESGLDHTEFRQYSSTTGRWLAPDSLKGNPGSPQSWNPYAYVLGDPIGNFDPLGQACSNVTSSGGVFRITCNSLPTVTFDGGPTGMGGAFNQQYGDPNSDPNGDLNYGNGWAQTYACQQIDRPDVSGVPGINATDYVMQEVQKSQAFQQSIQGADEGDQFLSTVGWLIGEFHTNGAGDPKNNSQYADLDQATKDKLADLGNYAFGAVMASLGFDLTFTDEAAGGARILRQLLKAKLPSAVQAVEFLSNSGLHGDQQRDQKWVNRGHQVGDLAKNGQCMSY